MDCAVLRVSHEEKSEFRRGQGNGRFFAFVLADVLGIHDSLLWEVS
jgi:hypothetical protein